MSFMERVTAIQDITALLTNKQAEIDEQLNADNGLPITTMYLNELDYQEHEFDIFKNYVVNYGKDKQGVKLGNDYARDGRVAKVATSMLRLFIPADEPDKVMLAISGKKAFKK
jgi:hypothetical protein